MPPSKHKSVQVCCRYLPVAFRKATWKLWSCKSSSSLAWCYWPFVNSVLFKEAKRPSKNQRSSSVADNSTLKDDSDLNKGNFTDIGSSQNDSTFLPILVGRKAAKTIGQLKARLKNFSQLSQKKWWRFGHHRPDGVSSAALRWESETAEPVPASPDPQPHAVIVRGRFQGHRQVPAEGSLDELTATAVDHKQGTIFNRLSCVFFSIYFLFYAILPAQSFFCFVFWRWWGTITQ